MKTKDIAKLGPMQLKNLYTATTIAISHTRKNILDTLSNFAFIPKDLEITDNEIFNEKLIKEYQEYISEFAYDKFIEQRSLQETVKKEIYFRIEQIKNDPNNSLIYTLCVQLAGGEMDIDNFVKFIDIITFHQERQKAKTANALTNTLLTQNPAQKN